MNSPLPSQSIVGAALRRVMPQDGAPQTATPFPLMANGASAGLLRAQAAAGNLDAVNAILAAGVDANADQGAAFVSACERGHLDVAIRLARAGADKVGNGLALMGAAGSGRVEVLAWLLGPNLNGGTHTKDQLDAALLAAAAQNQYHAVSILLLHGADASHDQSRALRAAVAGDCLESAALLMIWGADPRTRPDDERLPGLDASAIELSAENGSGQMRAMLTSRIHAEKLMNSLTQAEAARPAPSKSAAIRSGLGR